MKCTINFVLVSCIFCVVNVSNGLRLFPYCDYMHLFPYGDTEAILVKCFEEPFFGYTKCLDDYPISVTSQDELRSKVKLLKIDGSNCDERETAPLDGFFWNLRVLDYSFADTTTLHSNLRFKHLEVFNASHNLLSFLSPSQFEGQINLREIDFSYNYISNIFEETFDLNSKITAINLSHNTLPSVDPKIFSKLTELRVLDLSSNRIDSIDTDAFQNNGKLEILRLENNPIVRFDCHLFAPLKNLRTIGFSLESIEELDVSCPTTAFYPAPDNADAFVARISGTQNELRCTKEKIGNLRYFNIAGKQLRNTTQILPLLGEGLEFLDLSSNYLEKLDETTFQNFANLQQLKLSNTNISGFKSNPFAHQPKLKLLDISFNNLAHVEFSLLSKIVKNLVTLNIGRSKVENILELLSSLSPSLESLDVSELNLASINDNTFERFTDLKSLNLSGTAIPPFGFTTFFHQNQLEFLDISYNYWTVVDFTLFTRKLNNLRTLNLEGNQLYKIDGFTHYRFPKLTTLGISKNRFSCEYLATFLDSWPQLQITRNSDAKIHIDGIDCELNGSNDVGE